MPFVNTLKERIRARQVVVGTWILFVNTPGIVRMIAEAGYHFCVVDFQHSALGIETAAAMCDVGRGCGITPLVRPALLTQGEINRLQDAGAAGIMFPDVRSPEAVRRFRAWMQYPPVGERGVAVGGAGTDYNPDRGAPALARANDEAVLAIQIEHREGIEALDDILSGGGVDMVEIGRHDLAASLGVPGQFDHPRMADAMQRIIDCCERHDVCAGTGCEGTADAAALLDAGFRALYVGTDRRILTNSYRSTMAGLAPLLS